VTSRFGRRIDPFLGKPAMHTGIDFRAATGDPARATAGGTVVTAEYSGGYGNMVEIDHGNGISTRFGHMSRIDVTAGQIVSEGTIVGRAGSTGRSTGPHLHYEIRIDGAPIDPMRYIKRRHGNRAAALNTGAPSSRGGGGASGVVRPLPGAFCIARLLDRRGVFLLRMPAGDVIDCAKVPGPACCRAPGLERVGCEVCGSTTWPARTVSPWLRKPPAARPRIPHAVRSGCGFYSRRFSRNSASSRSSGATFWSC
jgi:hypothetical protein